MVQPRPIILQTAFTHIAPITSRFTFLCGILNNLHKTTFRNKHFLLSDITVQVEPFFTCLNKRQFFSLGIIVRSMCPLRTLSFSFNFCGILYFSNNKKGFYSFLRLLSHIGRITSNLRAFVFLYIYILFPSFYTH